jgi:hypothetical protein
VVSRAAVPPISRSWRQVLVHDGAEPEQASPAAATYVAATLLSSAAAICSTLELRDRPQAVVIADESRLVEPGGTR